jgi:hypothetical protein
MDTHHPLPVSVPQGRRGDTCYSVLIPGPRSDVPHAWAKPNLTLRLQLNLTPGPLSNLERGPGATGIPK